MKKKMAFIATLSISALYAAPTVKEPSANAPISEMTYGQLQEMVRKEVKAACRVVDPYAVIQSSKEWEHRQANIQKEAERQSKEIEKLAMQGEKMKADLRNMGRTAKKEAIEAKEVEIYRIENDIKIRQQQAQRNLQEMYETSQMELYKEIGNVAKEVAEEQGIMVVQAGGVLYVDPTIDISSQITDRANKKYEAHLKRQEKSNVQLAQNTVTPAKK